MKQQYLLHQTFFGPVHDWKERFLEESFILQLHMNFTYLDIRMMPTRYRHWYIKRLAKHFEKRSNMYEKANNPSSDLNKSNTESLNKFNDMMNKKFSS